MIRLFACLSSLICAASAVGASSFHETQVCGRAQVIEGYTCSNVKVRFDLKNCDVKETAPLATKVVCVGQQIKARYQEGDRRFEATFYKRDEGRGVSWVGDGVTHIFESGHQAATIAAAPPPPAEAKREPARVSNIDPTPVSPASPFKFWGFLDFRYTNFESNNTPLTMAPHAASGFGLEDGAFYATYEKGRLSVLAELNFRRSMDSDLNANASNPSESTNAAFQIGTSSSQLYMKYKISEDVVVDFGQFATIFGVEQNDSKDRFFGKTGLVYDYLMPVTHDGVMIEYATSGAYAKFLAADPNNQASYGSSPSVGDNTEYGVGLGYANSTVRAQIGYMTRPVEMADQSGYASRSLYDATAGVTLGRFSFDAEYSIVDDPSKNVLSPSTVGDHEAPATGALALLTFKISDSFSIGGRFEVVENVGDLLTGTIGIRQVDAGGIGVHYRMTPELELRTEFLNYNYVGITDEKWNDERFDFAALITF